MRNLRVNEQRLWDSLAQMARIGATDKGGVCRLALSDIDKAGRDLFVSWCEAAGCSVHVDELGNIFARRAGMDPALAPVMTGSHLDTQPTGGRFDGVYGVLSGLEVVRTLNDHGFDTQAPLEVVVWTNEEGCRFPPAMVGSGVFSGVFDVEYGRSRTDSTGVTLGSELERIGYAGIAPSSPRPIRAYFEAHIEQGPVLAREGTAIGAVVGAQGQRWYEVTLCGQEAHAGPTPMRMRRDALLGASKAVVEVNRIGLANGPDACATVGVLNVLPNARNTIPGSVFFTVDLRHPDALVLEGMDVALRAFIDQLGAAGLETELRQIWHSPPVAFDERCIDSVRRAADLVGLQHRNLISGAGHDACYISRIAPAAMIFIPCENGISHNEAENIAPADAAAGAQVLLACMVEHADGQAGER